MQRIRSYLHGTNKTVVMRISILHSQYLPILLFVCRSTLFFFTYLVRFMIDITWTQPITKIHVNKDLYIVTHLQIISPKTRPDLLLVRDIGCRHKAFGYPRQSTQVCMLHCSIDIVYKLLYCFIIHRYVSRNDHLQAFVHKTFRYL